MTATGARDLVARIDPSPEFARALIDALSRRLGEEWIKPGEFARRVNAHPNTVRNWCREGRVEHRAMPSGYVLVRASEVQRLLRPAKKGS